MGEQLEPAHVFPCVYRVGWPSTRQLPSGLIPMGEILATSGLISSGSVGDIQLSWHDAWPGAVEKGRGIGLVRGCEMGRSAGTCHELVSLQFSWR